MNFLIFFLLIIFTPYSFALSPKPAIGEPNFLGLREQAWIQLFNNDFVGGTDKLMTGNLSLGFFDSSWGFYFDQRLITQIKKTSYGTKELAEPIGINADVMSLNLVKEFKINKWQLLVAAGIDHLADNGAQDFADNLHHVIGGTGDENYEGQLKKGDFFAYNVQLQRELEIYKSFVYGVGTRSDFILREYYGFYNVSFKAKNFTLALGQYIVHHENSRIYNLTNYRIESTLGLSIGKYYSIFLHYLPPYVQDDSRGQLYLSPINFNYRW